jgi:hypothetical protein
MSGAIRINNALRPRLLVAGLLSTVAFPAPAPSAPEAAVVAKVEQNPGTVEAASHLVWVLSEAIGIASEGGTITMLGAQTLAQYRIVCTAGELTSVTRNYIAVGVYGRRTWSVQVKGGGMPGENTASLRSALAPICSM